MGRRCIGVRDGGEAAKHGDVCPAGRLMTVFLPYLRQQRSGSIVFMNSVYAHAGSPIRAAYVASKHAIAGE